MKIHLHTHTQVNCEVCNKTFPQTGYLKMHALTHNRDIHSLIQEINHIHATQGLWLGNRPHKCQASSLSGCLPSHRLEHDVGGHVLPGGLGQRPGHPVCMHLLPVWPQRLVCQHVLLGWGWLLPHPLLLQPLGISSPVSINEFILSCLLLLNRHYRYFLLPPTKY